MTVGELRKQLAGLHDEQEVLIELPDDACVIEGVRESSTYDQSGLPLVFVIAEEG